MNTKRRKLILNGIKNQIIAIRKKGSRSMSSEILSDMGIVRSSNSLKSLAGIKPQKLLRSILNIF